MFEFLKPNPATALLKEDHERVKALFDRFEEAKGRAAKTKVVRAALAELKVHAALEEELFYPSVPRGCRELPGAGLHREGHALAEKR
jgi:hypothetical protein